MSTLQLLNVNTGIVHTLEEEEGTKGEGKDVQHNLFKFITWRIERTFLI